LAGAFNVTITNLAKNDGLQCSSVVANRTDEQQSAELPNLDVTACSHGKLHIQLTTQIDSVHNHSTVTLDQQPDRKHTKIAPTLNTQKGRILLRQLLDHLALKMQVDNRSAFAVELVLKSLPVSDVVVIVPISKSISGFVNWTLTTGST
jgi:hypothetical protein